MLCTEVANEKNASNKSNRVRHPLQMGQISSLNRIENCHFPEVFQ